MGDTNKKRPAGTKKFNTIIKKNNVDLICNNFEVKNLYDRKIKNYRFDLSLLKETKKKIINHYLELSIIPQVISNLVRKEIITKNKILFKSDVYEDIFYFFRLVFFAKRIHVINEKLYMKNLKVNGKLRDMKSRSRIHKVDASGRMVLEAFEVSDCFF